MAPRLTVNQKELRQKYPDADLSGFTPTHRIQISDVRDPKKVLREDLVSLEEGPRTSYGYLPGEDDPAYYMLSTGLWKSFDIHGHVTATVVKYLEDFVPLHERSGFVYFIQSGTDGPIKIGWSQDISRRLSELQTANALALSVIGQVEGTMADEFAMHERFSHLRMEAEWFRNSSEIHAFLKYGDHPIESPEVGS